MTPVLAGQGRCRQSELELARLQADVGAWLSRRRRQDPRSQYYSQLRAIETLVDGAIAGLRRSVQAIDPGGSPYDVYGRCRAFDRRVAWLRRVWQFFAEKFDQRDDPALRDVLTAADEVVWSCYRHVVDCAQLAGLELSGPAPLPYIEPYLSPEIFPAELVPAGLTTEVDVEFAREHLNRLPIPVVRLQPACVSAPWWLVYLGHELGHHVQYALMPDMELVTEFRGAIEQAVTDAGASGEDAQRWGRWSREIFADVCSLLFMGQWALWAMTELEVAAQPAMTRRRSTYPAPAVRLLLLREAAAQLGLGGPDLVVALDLEAVVAADSGARADAALVARVVAAALGHRAAGGCTLSELTGFAGAEFGPGGAVELWRDRLLGPVQPLAEPSLDMARVLTSAGIAAWASVAADGDGRQPLAARLLSLIKQSAPEGTRAGADAGPDARELGEQLAGLLGRWEPEPEPGLA